MLQGMEKWWYPDGNKKENQSGEIGICMIMAAKHKLIL